MIRRLERAHRWLAQTVLAVLVLPILLSLLPQPAVSAEAALTRDVMLSICAQAGSQQDGQDSRHTAGHDHCVLCGAACPGAAPSLAAATPAFAGPPRRSVDPQAAAAGGLAPPLQALLDASPPRGPPLFS